MNKSVIEIKETAVLKGYNKSGEIVYDESISIHEYYDETHIWDSNEGILRLKIVRITGELYGDKGELVQKFETAFDEATGDYIGGKEEFEDGTRNIDGIYKNG